MRQSEPIKCGDAGISVIRIITLSVVLGGGTVADTAGGLVGAARAADPKEHPAERDFTQSAIGGRVVYLADALKQDFGISTVPEVSESVLAVKTPAGQLIPIVENLRGRAFRKDQRLREMDVEILARRYADQPFIQVLKLFEIAADGQRYEVDYWCDVCAIVMFESGPCSCCQDENRLRKRLVEP